MDTEVERPLVAVTVMPVATVTNIVVMTRLTFVETNPLQHLVCTIQRLHNARVNCQCANERFLINTFEW